MGEEPREFFLSRQLFERSDCQCHFAKSEREIAEMLIYRIPDIVLSTHGISGGSIHQLVALLSGSRASMFSRCVLKRVTGGCPFSRLERSAWEHLPYEEANSSMSLINY